MYATLVRVACSNDPDLTQRCNIFKHFRAVQRRNSRVSTGAVVG